MFSTTEFQNDQEYEAFYDDELLDLSFLETIESIDSLFAMSNSTYDIVASMPHNKAFVESLHKTVFEEPLHHVLWSASWPNTTRHFPY